MTRRKDDAPDAMAEPVIPEAVTAAALPSGESVVEEAPVPPTPDTPMDPVAGRQSRPSGVLGPLLGGALAAAAGFGLAHFNVFGLAAPDRSAEVAALGERLEAAVSALEAEQAGLDSRLQEMDALTGRVEALEAAPGAASGADTAALEQRLQAIEAMPPRGDTGGDPGGDASTAALAAKVAELEQRLAAVPQGGAATAEVDAALARLAEVEAEAQARADAAAAEAEAATQARALEVLAAAVASGAGFEAELAAVTDPDVQAALSPHVAGVASLDDLRAAFPEAAREALQVARAADAESGWGARLMDFLGAQTGARSLTPREGADPDAILSRAEFALGEGRLADALAELEALDPAVRAPLEAWSATARDRMAVDAAVAEAL